MSCESIEVPEYQPLTERQPMSSDRGETCIDSAAPTISSVPLTARPPWTALIASPLVAVARMTLAPPSLLQLRRGVLRLAVDVDRRAQLAGERLLVLAAGDADRVKAHLRGVLDAEVAEAAQAEHGDDVARPGAAVPQGVERGEAGAHQRGRLDGRQVGGHQRDRAGGGDHVLAVAAVDT